MTPAAVTEYTNVPPVTGVDVMARVSTVPAAVTVTPDVGVNPYGTRATASATVPDGLSTKYACADVYAFFASEFACVL